MRQAMHSRSLQITQGHGSLSALLQSGGDSRIAVDPVTGRNKYGVPPAPAPHDIWLSSSTASATSQLGFDAANAAFKKLLAGSEKTGETIERWFDDLRARIAILGGRDGTEVILCASGTETEFLGLALSRHLLCRPLTNIVIAVEESGAGVSHAATGAHFDATTALDGQVQRGLPLLGWEGVDIEVVKIDIRDAAGALLPLEEVDGVVREQVSRACKSGRDVQLHILDASKTGRGGPSRAAVRSIAAEHPERISVVVDACQLRCSFEDIKADLENGFMVMITGSKFVGGPPFCGALLIPPNLIDRLDGLTVPPGLTDYSARMDWPSRLRHALRRGDYASFNPGLGLRWEAALAEIESYLAIEPERRTAVIQAFGQHVRTLVGARPHLRLLDSEAGLYMGRAQTIFPIISGDGAPERIVSLHRAFREKIAASDAALDRDCHIGQPVTIADRAALRVCLGMPTIRRIAEQLDRIALPQAFSPLAEELDIAFRKWDFLESRSCAAPAPARPDDTASRRPPSAQPSGDPHAIFATAHPDEPINKAEALSLMSSISGRSPLALAKELFSLARGPGRLSFRDYINYRLFDDAFVAGADKSAFIGRRRNQELNAQINYRHEWNGIADDKIATASFLAAYGLPVVPTKAIYAPYLGRGNRGILRTSADMWAFLSDPTNYPLFGKPTDGLQSLGSIVLKSLDTETRLIETAGPQVSIDSLVEAIAKHFGSGYIFQPRLTSHATVTAAIGAGLSTVRLVTIATDDGPRLFASAWKLLAGGNIADNYWRPGNILAAIDPGTGLVLRATTGTGFAMRQLDHHPMTGAELQKLALPMMSAAIDVAIEGHRALRNIGIIGWDIGVTDEGPVVVEANVTPDLVLLQAANRSGAFNPQMAALLKRQKAGATAHYQAMKATMVKD